MTFTPSFNTQNPKRKFKGYGMLNRKKLDTTFYKIRQRVEKMDIYKLKNNVEDIIERRQERTKERYGKVGNKILQNKQYIK